MQGILMNLIKPPKEEIIFTNISHHHTLNPHLSLNIQEYNIQGIPTTLYLKNIRNPTILYIHSYNSDSLQVKSILKQLIISFNVASVSIQRVSVKQGRGICDSNGIITFGYYEYQQINTVMSWLRQLVRGQIIIWGRSMGAVIAIKYQSIYNGADKLVLDSPYNDLIDIFFNAIQHSTCMGIFLQLFFFIFKSQISKVLQFDPQSMKMVDYMKFTCPVYFICNMKDAFSNKSTQILYQVHRGYKKIFYTNSGHNQHRQINVIADLVKSLINQNQKYFRKSSLKTVYSQQKQKKSF